MLLSTRPRTETQGRGESSAHPGPAGLGALRMCSRFCPGMSGVVPPWDAQRGLSLGCSKGSLLGMLTGATPWDDWGRLSRPAGGPALGCPGGPTPGCSAGPS